MNLIVLKQAPIIAYERMAEVSEQVQQRIALLDIDNLVVDDENVKKIKNLRTELNKEFAEFENQRKLIKEAVTKPYQEFENCYKTLIEQHYKSADGTLKEKVFSVENQLKINKENEVKTYFDEYKAAQQCEFLEYPKHRINVTLTASLKNLKEQAKQFIDDVVLDIERIKDIPEDDAFKKEVFFHYKKTLDFSGAWTLTANRKKALEAEQVQENEKQPQTEEPHQSISPKTEEVSTMPLQAPKEEALQEASQSVELFVTSFQVRGTKEQLIALKQFIINNHIEIL